MAQRSAKGIDIVLVGGPANGTHYVCKYDEPPQFIMIPGYVVPFFENVAPHERIKLIKHRYRVKQIAGVYYATYDGT